MTDTPAVNDIPATVIIRRSDISEQWENAMKALFLMQGMGTDESIKGTVRTIGYTLERWLKQ